MIEEDAVPGRELLERFRPAAAPGAVGRVGVPADVHEDAELLGVLAALGPTLAQVETLREQGRRSARSLTEETARQLQAIEATARLDAAEAQAVAAAQTREIGRREGERLVAEATTQAKTLLAEGERDIAAVVERVLAALRAELTPEAAASGDAVPTAVRGRP